MRTYLILDQELDTLDGSSSSLRDGGRDTTHCYHWSVSDTSNCAPKPSFIHACGGDNDLELLVEEDVLKKSITKGGLLIDRSA